MTFAAITDSEVKHCDIVTAFLHGDIEEDLYIKQPIGFEVGTSPSLETQESHIRCQSARAFYIKLDK